MSRIEIVRLWLVNGKLNVRYYSRHSHVVGIDTFIVSNIEMFEC